MTTRAGFIAGLLLFLFALVAVSVCAQTGGEPAGSPAAVPTTPQTAQAGAIPAPGLDFPVIRTIGGLGVVISLIVLGFFAARKYAPQLFNRRPGEQRLKVIETLPMGDRRSIALVQVEDAWFLIGNTAQQISLLAQLPREFSHAAEREAPQAAASGPAGGRESRDSFRNLYEVEKKQSASRVGKPKAIPPDVRAKMRQLREALEQ